MKQPERGPLRLLLFVIIVAAILAYVAFKAGKFDDETMARFSPSVSPVVISDGSEVTSLGATAPGTGPEETMIRSGPEETAAGAGTGRSGPEGGSVSAEKLEPAAAVPARGSSEEWAKASDRDFYMESRLERERARSRQIELLEAVIDNPNSSSQVRDRAQEELLALSRQATLEAETESLIRAKGFADALVYLHRDGAVVVVRTELLSRADAALIMDIVRRVASIPVEGISVVSRPE